MAASVFRNLLYGSRGIIIAAAFLVVGSFTGAASAATITVTNNDNNGAGSLRRAVQNAATGDTIVFSSAVRGTIALADEIEIDKTLTIVGPGASNLTLSGDTSRLLNIGSGDGEIDVTLEGLRFANGSDSSGAAIYSAQDASHVLTVRNCVFARNAATSSGGAIGVFDDAALVVADSSFTANVAVENGGAIRHDSSGSLTVTNSVFRRNSMDDYYGGAIDVSGSGAATISQSMFYQNTAGADGDGGAIGRSGSGDLTVTASTFIGNATGDGDDGGAIFSTNTGALSVIDSTFSGNVAADDGGAIYSNSTGDLSVVDSTFENNVGASDGAAINRRQAGTVVISGSTFIGNTEQEDRGIIYMGAPNIALTVANAALVENVGSDDVGPAGLYFNSSGGTATITNTTIADNVSADGDGAALYVANGAVTLDGVTISGNVTGTYGAVYRTGGSVTVSNSIIAGNRNGAGPADCTGTLTFAGGDNTSILGVDNSCAAGDTPKSGAAGLGPLRISNRVDGKGTTWIVPLQVGSPALDSGATTLATDQRGVVRPQGSAPDIGAVEMRPSALGISLTVPSYKVTQGSHAFIVSRVTNLGDFAISDANLAFGFPAAYLSYNGGAEGATCNATPACDVGNLAGEQARSVTAPVMAKEIGLVTVSATVAASGFASASASGTFEIVGASPNDPAAAACVRQLTKIVVAGSPKKTTIANVKCRFILNQTGTFTFSFAKKAEAKTTAAKWNILKGSIVAGSRTKRTGKSVTVDNVKSGRQVSISFRLPKGAHWVPVTVDHSGQFGPTVQVLG